MSRTYRRFAFVSAFLALSATALAAPTSAASACEEGLVITEATDGHCCWPGQTWSEERERCAGVPRCPEGWTTQGSICVRGGVVERDTQTPEKPAPIAQPTPQTENKKPAVESLRPEKTATPPAALTPPAAEKPIEPEEEWWGAIPDFKAPPKLAPPNPIVHWNPTEESNYDGGPIPPGATLHWRARSSLAVPGFIMATVGYGASVLMFASASGCPARRPISWVPVVGAGIAGIASRAVCHSEGFRGSLPISLADSGMQAAGLVMIIAGFVRPQQYLVYDAPPAEMQGWNVVPGTQATPNGLTFVADF